MLFEKINSLIEQKNFKEALKVIDENQKELFFANAISTVNNHIFLLLELEMYDLCYEILENYMSYPYQNMEVEEHLAYVNSNLQNMIKNSINQKNRERNFDENGVDFSKFNSKKEDDLNTFIYQIYRSKKYHLYENEIELILKRNISDHINFMCLCILYEINSDKLVDFQYKNSNFSIKLYDLHFPFSEDDIEYLEVLNVLNRAVKDVSIYNLSKDLLGSLRLEIFPDKLEINDVPFIVEALIHVTKMMYGQTNILAKNERIDFYINLLQKITNS
jgi:hypothetical protein